MRRPVLASILVAAVLLAAAAFLLWPRWDVANVSTNLGLLRLPASELAARNIKTIELGELELPTGEIVVADPLVTPERDPLERKVSPGRYPVTLYAAQGRTAVAVLRFAPGIPERWELAILPGQKISELKRDEFFGYPVDAGLGSFMDRAALQRMLAREARDKQAGDTAFNYYDSVLAKELTANGDDYALHRPMPDDPVNIAIFSSGWGDGSYPSFWGLDASGRPLVLLTDFFVMEHAHGGSQ